MIPGKDTNTVYFSQLLSTDSRFAATCNTLTSLLDKHDVNYKFLKGTKIIWCRDYMPIQTSLRNFVQFRYEPSYLEDDENIRSDPQKPTLAIDHYPLIIDHYKK